MLIDAGKFRRGGVGIHKGSKVVHVAPPAKWVPILMADLLNWVNTADDHALIKSCVFHYELEFIHAVQSRDIRRDNFLQYWATI
ncbi:MAG: Fic family protein [Cyanobacteria bacterium P01_D01_bin.44]